MSSHREAPAISKDPVADSTDLYAFVSPDRPDTVTILANYVPLEAPDGGPNFYEFGDDVSYRISIGNRRNHDADDIVYEFRFHTETRNPDTFLYNTGPITSLDAPTWNRRQFFSVTRHANDGTRLLASRLACPPCNIGPLSTPNYSALAAAAVHPLPGGGLVFAGQRAEGFYVDLGAIFDLGTLRPFQAAHAGFGLPGLPLANMPGVNATANVNVHTIAIQVPIAQLTHHGETPHDPTSAAAVLGVWTSASRHRVRIIERGEGTIQEAGQFVQVSRLGNPLFNEVIVPISDKDLWNALPPTADDRFAKYVAHPEVAGLLPVLYPGVFPHLATLDASGAARTDLVAILLTGIPSGVVPGFQNFTGSDPQDLLRLNVAIPPSAQPNILGILGGDLAGYPNGRRVFDDVTTIELRAIAGATYPLVHPAFTPDSAVGAITDLQAAPTDVSIAGTEHYIDVFPYLGVPHSGYTTPDAPTVP